MQWFSATFDVVKKATPAQIIQTLFVLGLVYGVHIVKQDRLAILQSHAEERSRWETRDSNRDKTTTESLQGIAKILAESSRDMREFRREQQEIHQLIIKQLLRIEQKDKPKVGESFPPIAP